MPDIEALRSNELPEGGTNVTYFTSFFRFNRRLRHGYLARCVLERQRFNIYLSADHSGATSVSDLHGSPGRTSNRRH